MKRSLLLFSVLLTVAISPMARAESTSLTDQYIASIKVGCTDALQGMLRVQKTEAATRVNRGREYETLLRHIAAFNSRVILNLQEAPALTSTAARIQTGFDTFRRDYLDYADKVDAALAVNCKTAPVTFYDKLTAAREARTKVANDVRAINGLLDEYQTYLNDLKAFLLKSETGETQ